MNTTKVEFYNDTTKEYEDVTAYVVNDFKYANLLDEQLDESTITLKKYPVEEIRPLTLIRFTVTNAPEATYNHDMFLQIVRDSDYDVISSSANSATLDYGRLVISFDPTTKKITQTFTREYFIATDNAEESPVGSGLYDHELYAIELTKLTEGFIGDSISFTNPLGNNFLDT